MLVRLFYNLLRNCIAFHLEFSSISAIIIFSKLSSDHTIKWTKNFLQWCSVFLQSNKLCGNKSRGNYALLLTSKSQRWCFNSHQTLLLHPWIRWLDMIDSRIKSMNKDDFCFHIQIIKKNYRSMGLQNNKLPVIKSHTNSYLARSRIHPYLSQMTTFAIIQNTRINFLHYKQILSMLTAILFYITNAN